MTQTFVIPADVAEHIRQTGVFFEKTAQRLQRLHDIYGQDNTDTDMGDGDIWEWTVDIDHSEVERLITSLHKAAEFNDWLAKSTAPAPTEKVGAE